MVVNPTSINIAGKIYSIPFEDVIGYYGISSLPRAHGLFINCPFHKDDTASFYAGGKDNFGHCFGCGKSYDLVRFVRDYKNLNYHEALRELCRIGGIEATDEELKNVTGKDRWYWMRYGGDEDARKEKQNKEIRIVMAKVQQDFIVHALRYPLWDKTFRNYVDWCWYKYDLVAMHEPTVEVVDAVKDWAVWAKKFLREQFPKYRQYKKFVMETWRSQVESD